MSKVVFTNGCFDILHQGHYALFKYCRDLAGEDGKVVLGIDTDERIKANKGEVLLVTSTLYIDLTTMSGKGISI